MLGARIKDVMHEPAREKGDTASPCETVSASPSHAKASPSRASAVAPCIPTRSVSFSLLISFLAGPLLLDGLASSDSGHCAALVVRALEKHPEQKVG